ARGTGLLHASLPVCGLGPRTHAARAPASRRPALAGGAGHPPARPAGRVRGLRALVRAPIRFCLGNLLWSGGRREVWALYRLAMTSYPERPRSQKLALLGELATLCYALERDLQVLRVTRAFSPAGYLDQARACLDPRHARRDESERYLDLHRRVLHAQEVARPECYLGVRIAGPAGSLSEQCAALFAGRGDRRG